MGSKTQKPQKVDLRALYNKSYAGKYITAVEIDHLIKVVISDVKIESVESWQKGTKAEDKMVLYFEGKKRGIVINKTNFKQLAKDFGWEKEDWIGETVTLQVKKIKAFGRMVDSIEIQKPVEIGGDEERIESGEVKV